MYTQEIANYFLNRAHEENTPISQLKLLKLVYIGYGWVAAVEGKRLFEEDIQAWKHGPVIPSLYHEFKHYGSAPIEGQSLYVDLDNLDAPLAPEIPESEGTIIFLLSMVWDIYSRFSAWDLRNKTHEPDTPWSDTYDPSEQGKVIPFDLIKSHFVRKLGEYLDAAEGRAASLKTA